MKNLTLENITKVCGGTYHGDMSVFSKEVAGVVIDSRKVEKDLPLTGSASMPTSLFLTR